MTALAALLLLLLLPAALSSALPPNCDAWQPEVGYSTLSAKLKKACLTRDARRTLRTVITTRRATPAGAPSARRGRGRCAGEGSAGGDTLHLAIREGSKLILMSYDFPYRMVQ